MSPYRRRTFWEFVPVSERCMYDPFWVYWDGEVLLVEEVRKNGQEDTHVSEELCQDGDGVWGFAWDEPDVKQSIDRHMGDGCANAILDYINEHGAPPQGTGG